METPHGTPLEVLSLWQSFTEPAFWNKERPRKPSVSEVTCSGCIHILYTYPHTHIYIYIHIIIYIYIQYPIYPLWLPRNGGYSKPHFFFCEGRSRCWPSTVKWRAASKRRSLRSASQDCDGLVWLVKSIKWCLFWIYQSLEFVSYTTDSTGHKKKQCALQCVLWGGTPNVMYLFPWCLQIFPGINSAKRESRHWMPCL